VTLRTRARQKVYPVAAGEPISEITPQAADREIVLRFTDSRSILNDAGNVRLSGKVDMKGNPGDLLCLISDGTSWDETSRMVR
jgi:hypothetical protein